MKVEIGDKFGYWTVIGKGDKKYTYRCRCVCGKEKDVLRQSLINGKSTSCGCKKVDKNLKAKYESTDKKILGHKFGLLTPIKRINSKGISIYECKCDCGNVVKVEARHLLSGSVVSCGCKKKEDVKKLSEKYFAKARKKIEELSVEGTQLNSLKQKVSKNSTTGVKGVSHIQTGSLKGKYRADIGFKGKRIYLGTFDNLADAIKVRREAEEKYFNPLVDKYSK